jgi:hypothetical protein
MDREQPDLPVPVGDLPRLLLYAGVPRGGRRDDELLQRGLERPGLVDLLAEFLHRQRGTKQQVLVLALDPGPTGSGGRPAEHVDALLRLPPAAVALGVEVVPLRTQELPDQGFQFFPRLGRGDLNVV